MNKRPRWDPAWGEDLRNYHAAGESWEELAVRFGYSRAYHEPVRQRVRQLGLPDRRCKNGGGGSGHENYVMSVGRDLLLRRLREHHSLNDVKNYDVSALSREPRRLTPAHI